MVFSKFSELQEELEILELEVKLLKLLRIKKNRQIRRIKKRKYRFWIRQIYEHRRRASLGVFSTLFQELKNDREQFFRYTRTSPDRLYQLLGLVQEKNK